MQDLAEAMNTTYQYSEGVYSIEMPTTEERTQIVDVMLRESGVGGDMIVFYTPVAPIADDVDWQPLLELNVDTIYARVATLEGYIVVVAGQMLDSADVSEVLTILAEVGTLGDALERFLTGEEDQF
jgi:hypothetical protein